MVFSRDSLTSQYWHNLVVACILHEEGGFFPAPCSNDDGQHDLRNCYECECHHPEPSGPRALCVSEAAGNSSLTQQALIKLSRQGLISSHQCSMTWTGCVEWVWRRVLFRISSSLKIRPGHCSSVPHPDGSAGTLAKAVSAGPLFSELEIKDSREIIGQFLFNKVHLLASCRSVRWICVY